MMTLAERLRWAIGMPSDLDKLRAVRRYAEARVSITVSGTAKALGFDRLEASILVGQLHILGVLAPQYGKWWRASNIGFRAVEKVL